MTSREFLTRATIWLALGGYTVGAVLRLTRRHDPMWRVAARWAWTLGGVFFLAQVVCAFGVFHNWSHTDAYVATAQDTAAMTGVRWGGGLYLNYLFAVALLADVAWWWLAPAQFATRSSSIGRIWAGFSFFMVFNGTVVFGDGPVQWYGVMICAALGFSWWRRCTPCIGESGARRRRNRSMW